MHTSEPSHRPSSPPVDSEPVPEEGLEFWIALAVMVALFVGALLFIELTAFGT